MVCRTTHGILRLIKRGATALPGALALKIYPGILSLAAEGVRIIAVTGTNGKTTSCRMLEKMLSDDGEDVLLNRSGANLRKGIATELILNLSLFGRPKKRTVVIECDEAAARTVLGEIRPAVLLVTNLFKDQMDRYGSVAAPFEAIKAGLIKSPKTLLCANADSPFAAMFAAQTPNECRFFGFRSGTKKSTDSGESGECPRCGARLSYRFVSYANLGDFEKAEKNYIRAQELNPELPQVYINLADIYYRQKDMASGVGLMMTGLSYLPDNLVLRHYLARFYMEDAKLDLAIDELANILEKQPDNYDVYYDLGKVHFELGNYACAIENFENVLEYKSENPLIYYYLGEAYEANDEIDKAISNFLKTIARNEAFSPAYKKVAILFMARGDYEDAIEYFEDYMELDIPEEEKSKIKELVERIKKKQNG